jgi:uncharacterized protein YdaU (DUF1376 family)
MGEAGRDERGDPRMSRPDGWMPLWIGDYLADTMHLSGPEHGAYLLLLMHSWRSGPLPDDDRLLAAIARTDRAAWKEIGPTVRAFFQKTDAGLVQGRLERERENAEGNAERRSEAARTAATKRWQGNANAMRDASATHASRNARRNASRMPNAMRDECPTPSPSPEEDNPLTPAANAAGEPIASKPKNSRAHGTSPRQIAAVAAASAPPPPEPDHALWPRAKAAGVSQAEFRHWLAPLVHVEQIGGRPALIAPSKFHADHVRADFSHVLDGCEVRARPDAAHG